MKVESGHLDDVTWEEGSLLITFKDGKTYRYEDVPMAVYNELVGASSKSEFFRDNIKGVYEFERL